ncbi:MAG: ribosome maturation factor RimP [candidate division NC10 bacterium]|nr:ribosome maturation factor RimP [candidate division NC10 bacterium]
MARARGGASPAADILGRVRPLAETVAAGQGHELVGVEFRREAHGWILRIFIDHPGGVTLDHCQRMSEELGDHLDVEDLIAHPYHLEVSSPGLDRPLTREADFVRFAGRDARIMTREAMAGQRNFRGRLAGQDGRAIILERSDGQRVAIPYDLILKARLEPEL